MKVVPSFVGEVKGFYAIAALLFIFAGSARAQDVQPDGFHVGDKIALSVDGPLLIRDTATVREGLVVRLAGLSDISMAGVKRADVQKYLTQEISKFIKDPIVHATALVRIAVLGQVMRPGFYTVPSDALLADVVMTAGGPTPTADLNRTVLQRAGQDVKTRDQMAAALESGATIDQMQIAPGDALVIGDKPTSSVDTILKVIGVAVPLLTLALYFHSRH
ncbi:MAG: SLBB domain-containing protein [Gemmatimonadaceae bacterium]